MEFYQIAKSWKHNWMILRTCCICKCYCSSFMQIGDCIDIESNKDDECLFFSDWNRKVTNQCKLQWIIPEVALRPTVFINILWDRSNSRSLLLNSIRSQWTIEPRKWTIEPRKSNNLGQQMFGCLNPLVSECMFLLAKKNISWASWYEHSSIFCPLLAIKV